MKIPKPPETYSRGMIFPSTCPVDMDDHEGCTEILIGPGWETALEYPPPRESFGGGD